MRERIHRLFSERWERKASQADADRWWDELLAISESNRSEWERVVQDNSELQEDIRRIRNRYRLPIDDINHVPDWMERNQDDYFSLQADVKEVMGKHEISKGWWTPLLYLVLTGEPFGLVFRLGFPGGKVDIVEDEWKVTLLLSADVKITNPLVQEAILRQQVLENPPPLPTKIPGTRKLDWRPLWEWYERHKELSIKELSEIIGYSYPYVRRKRTEYDEMK